MNLKNNISNFAMSNHFKNKQTMFKKTLLLFLGIMIPLICLADGPIIVVTFPPTSPPIGNNQPHAPAQPVVGGYYDMVSEEMVLTFLTDLGACVVTVSSDNGSFYQEFFDTANGTLVMSFPAVQGLYTVSIQTIGGTMVSTPFLIL